MANNYTPAITNVIHIGEGQTVAVTPQQEKMAHYLAQGKAPTDARLLAGYTDNRLNTAMPANKAQKYNRDLARQMLDKQPQILMLAHYIQMQERNKLSLTTEDILKTVAYQLHFDPATLFHVDGSPKLIHDIPYAARMAIKKMKTATREDPNGAVTTFTEYEFYDKNQALATLTKLQTLLGSRMEARMKGKSVSLTKQV